VSAPTDASTVYTSGGLFTPGILAELSAGPAKGEFAPGSFRRLDGTLVEDLDRTIEAGFGQLCDRYDAIRENLATMDRSALRDRWALPLLRFLDWDPHYQAAHLKPSAVEDTTFAVSHLGWDDPTAPPVHVEPTGDAALGLDARPAPRALSPHDLVQRYLNLAPQQWGVVTDGREIRILRDFHHTTAKGFVAVDLVALFESRRFEDFRALYRLAHVSRFLPMDPGDNESAIPLEALYARSRAAGVSVGRALHPQVRRTIEVLARGIAANDSELRARLADAAAARAFYGEVLRVVYRLLFLFFAEQRGMLPGRDTLYAETYSVTRLRDLADRAAEVEGRRTDLYEGLKVTFRLMSTGSDALGVKPFDGHLFDAAETPAMTAGTITNRELIRAIRSLTNVDVEGQRQHVAYATIGVEELGAVYESLLDYTPRIAEHALVSDTGETVPAGGLYLERIGDRELGSYYTPPDLVDFTLEVSLDRLLEERLTGATDPSEAERALLDLRLIDPACGSGAFLVATIDRLASRLTDIRLQGAQPTEAQLSAARRDVLQHCVYGVDIDPFAVELCKVALWIHCSVADLPLTFLDHRIQCGNSLVGWPLRDIPTEIPAEAYQTKAKTKGDVATKAVCQSARDRNLRALAGQGDLFTGDVARPDITLDYPTLWLEEERTPADVEKKATAYAEYLDSTAYRPVGCDRRSMGGQLLLDRGCREPGTREHRLLAGPRNRPAPPRRSLARWRCGRPSRLSRGGCRRCDRRRRGCLPLAPALPRGRRAGRLRLRHRQPAVGSGQAPRAGVVCYPRCRDRGCRGRTTEGTHRCPRWEQPGLGSGMANSERRGRPPSRVHAPLGPLCPVRQRAQHLPPVHRHERRQHTTDWPGRIHR
jgi:hypothetical protein